MGSTDFKVFAQVRSIVEITGTIAVDGACMNSKKMAVVDSDQAIGERSGYAYFRMAIPS